MVDYIYDPRLSLKAKGLLTILLEEQEIGNKIDGIICPSSDKDVTINSAFKELMKAGYLSDLTQLIGNEPEHCGLIAFRFANDGAIFTP